MRVNSGAGSGAEPETSSRARAQTGGDGRVALRLRRDAVVHRGDAEEHRPAVAQRLRGRRGVEAHEVAQVPAEAQRAERPEHEAVDVEERQCVHEPVLAGPLPGVGQRVEVRGDRAPRHERALGPPGGARRVDDERRGVVVEPFVGGQRAALRVDVDGRDRRRRVRGVQRALGGAQHDLRLRVADDVGQLARAQLRVQRDELDPGGQAADDGDAGLERGLRPDGGAAHAAQALGDGGRGVAQLAVGELPVAEAQGGLGVQLVDRRQEDRHVCKFLAGMGTHEPAVRAAVRNHTSWMTAQAEAGGGGPRSHGSLRWIVSADGGSASLPFPDAVAGDDADAMLADCRARGQTGIGCWTSGLDPIGEIAAVLVARGFEWGWSAHWMAFDLDALPRIDDDRVRVEPGPVRDSWKAFAPGAGQAIVHLADGEAGLYDVGVEPGMQRSGLGRALTVAALDAARRAGATLATVNATEDGERLYRAVGAQSAGHGQTFWIHGDGLAAPVPPALVAAAEAAGRGRRRAPRRPRCWPPGCRATAWGSRTSRRRRGTPRPRAGSPRWARRSTRSSPTSSTAPTASRASRSTSPSGGSAARCCTRRCGSATSTSCAPRWRRAPTPRPRPHVRRHAPGVGGAPAQPGGGGVAYTLTACSRSASFSDVLRSVRVERSPMM